MYPSVSSSSSNLSRGVHKQDDRIQLPSVPDSFPEVESSNMAELQDLLDSDDILEATFRGLEMVRSVEELRQSINHGNVAIAKKNLEQKTSIEEMTEEIVSLQTILKREKANYDALLEKQNTIMQRFSPQKLGLRLGHAAKKVDESSEEVASRFLRSEIPLAEFLSTF
jgi:seryl-tRNA synthetase